MKQVFTLLILISITFSIFAQDDSTKIKVLNKNIVTVVDGGNKTNVKVGNEKGIEVITDDFGDTTRIRIGNRTFDVVEDHHGTHINVTKKEDFTKKYSPRMNGLWGGVEMGFNLFAESDYSLYDGDEFMELQHAKSASFNINFAEFTFADKSNSIGIVTGFGLSSVNYRFDQPITLVKENKMIVPEPLYVDNLKKSKLNITYITVPLMLQIKTPFKFNSYHMNIAAGVIGGVNIGAHTKIKYDDNKQKDRGNFNLTPFKYELTGRLGFGELCFFANYSLSPLFKDGRGPELYPLTFGILFPNFY